ncbi:hypothetical protein CHS0354_001598, partial [Potamilus streckersoni]
MLVWMCPQMGQSYFRDMEFSFTGTVASTTSLAYPLLPALHRVFRMLNTTAVSSDTRWFRMRHIDELFFAEISNSRKKFSGLKFEMRCMLYILTPIVVAMVLVTLWLYKMEKVTIVGLAA